MIEYLESVQKINNTFFYSITSYGSEYIVSASVDATKFGGKFKTRAEMEAMFREKLKDVEAKTVVVEPVVKKGTLNL